MVVPVVADQEHCFAVFAVPADKTLRFIQTRSRKLSPLSSLTDEDEYQDAKDNSAVAGPSRIPDSEVSIEVSIRFSPFRYIKGHSLVVLSSISLKHLHRTTLDPLFMVFHAYGRKLIH